MNINDLLDTSELTDLIADGKVTERSHPQFPELRILNYSATAAFIPAAQWSDTLSQCRGLIYNADTGEILARPWKKFFNYGQDLTVPIPQGPLYVAPKEDGSMGILYRQPDGEYAIATRGSFASDQAIKGTNMFSFGEWSEFSLKFLPEEGRTYLFEICYPENRIVKNYGDFEGLILLDVLDNETGLPNFEEFENIYWPHKAEKRLLPSFSETLKSEIPQGDEGFVLYWPESDLRLKIKSDWYLSVHKAVFGLSKRSVWECLGHGMTVDEICEPLPDEFHDWVRSVAEDLQEKCDGIVNNAIMDYFRVVRRLSDNPTKKEFALLVKDLPNSGLLFKCYDGYSFDDLWPLVWKTLRPVGQTAAVIQSEDTA